MRTLPFLAVAAPLLVAFLAGCLAPAPPAADAPPPPSNFDASTGSVGGRVVTQEDLPARDATVVLRRVGSDAPAFTTATTVEGRFAFHYVRPATYELAASAPGYAGDSRTVEVRAGHAATGIVLELARADVATP